MRVRVRRVELHCVLLVGLSAPGACSRLICGIIVSGCVVDSAGTLGPCTTDDGGFAYGGDGRGLGGMGVRTAWRRGDVVEVGFSIRSNQLRPFILHASVPRRPLAVL